MLLPLSFSVAEDGSHSLGAAQDQRPFEHEERPAPSPHLSQRLTLPQQLLEVFSDYPTGGNRVTNFEALLSLHPELKLNVAGETVTDSQLRNFSVFQTLLRPLISSLWVQENSGYIRIKIVMKDKSEAWLYFRNLPHSVVTALRKDAVETTRSDLTEPYQLRNYEGLFRELGQFTISMNAIGGSDCSVISGSAKAPH